MILDARVVNRWLEECGRIDPLYPTETSTQMIRGGGVRESTWHLYVNEHGHLMCDHRKDTTEMARFVGERRLMSHGGGAVLLNGDGFDHNEMQAVQTRIRDWTHRKMGTRSAMIIPFQALNGSGIVYDTILPIHVSGDRWTDLTIPIEAPPRDSWPGLGTRQSVQFEWEKKEWMTFRFNMNQRGLSVMHQPRNGTPSWHTVQTPTKNPRVRERVHNLGSTVFNAVGPDGSRHRYLSAFDADEPTAMYFLAQLPDQGAVLNYMDALDLLSPPIVHQAREQGRSIKRQGDVFAIETDLDDMYFKDAKIVRRDQVFTPGEGATRGCKYTRRHRFVKNLMIYGTGHTATIVAVKPSGSTFAKGVMFHDPILEQAGREREHQNVELGNKWHLMVRNTVPRITPTTEEKTDVNDSSTHNLPNLWRDHS